MQKQAQPLISHQSGPLNGTVTPPGDKSISHRAIMLGGIANGTTNITGLLEGEDVLCTVAALKALGATITKQGSSWQVKGTGLQNMRAPDSVVDVGNSGTSARLLIGLLGTQKFSSSFTGDASLCKRPMGRVMTPLEQMGSTFVSEVGGRLPLTVTGAAQPKPISYQLPVASAQVKSAIMLAALNAAGTTTVIEAAPTRDHTERMLRHFGVKVEVKPTAKGEAISVTGPVELTARDVIVPGDISSAAFPMVAALLRSGSHVTLQNVGLNPRRAGLVQTLQEMGADITLTNQREAGGEPVADLVVKGSVLRGVTVPADRAPSMIDEFPVLAMAAACATGTMRMCGLGELRVKESDRLALVADGLKACGVKVEIEGDDLIVHGNGQPPRGGATILTAMDHRIAMSFLVLGIATSAPVTIDDGSYIATSFPTFIAMMNGLGAKISAL